MHTYHLQSLYQKAHGFSRGSVNQPMARPRPLRYQPSTTDTVSWTHRCGRRRHRIHLIRGALVLPDHSREEIARALLKAGLGQVPPPCIQALLALRQRSDHLDSLNPILFPQTVRDAVLVARFARRHRHAPIGTQDLGRDQLRQRAAERVFADLFATLHQAQLAGALIPIWHPEALYPTVVLPYARTTELLIYREAQWRLSGQAAARLTYESRFNVRGDAILPILTQWITERNTRRSRPHGKLLHPI